MRRFTIHLLAASFLAGCMMTTVRSDSSMPESEAAKSGPTVIEEFQDIPIPTGLKRIDDQSFVYEAPGVAIGVVTFSGRGEAIGIADFFRQEMPVQGWRFQNTFKSGRSIDLFFVKASRSCQISIRSGLLATKVIVKVGSSTSSEPVRPEPQGPQD